MLSLMIWCVLFCIVLWASIKNITQKEVLLSFLYAVLDGLFLFIIVHKVILLLAERLSI